MANQEKPKKTQKRVKKTPKETIKEWVITIVVALVVAFFFRTVFFEPRQIPTGSMIPSIKIHEFIFVKMFEYDWHIPYTTSSLVHRRDPEPGDIIVFPYPVDPSKDYIKRVIAGPGDVVEVRNKRVYINGEALKLKPIEASQVGPISTKYEDFSVSFFKETRGQYSYTVMHINERATRDYGPRTVPADKYFVMGDNRDDSLDSRIWGFVDREEIIGRGSMIWLSFDIDRFPWVRFERLFSFLH